MLTKSPWPHKENKVAAEKVVSPRKRRSRFHLARICGTPGLPASRRRPALFKGDQVHGKFPAIAGQEAASWTRYFPEYFRVPKLKRNYSGFTLCAAVKPLSYKNAGAVFTPALIKL